MMKKAELLILAVVLTLAGCASAPDKSSGGGSDPSTTAPPPAPPPPAPPPPPLPPPPPPPPPGSESGWEGLPDDEFFENLPDTGAGSPSPGGRSVQRNRTTELRTPDKIQDFLPFIDVAIDDNVSLFGTGSPFQDRYTRIQILTLDPDAFDTEGVATGTRKTKEDTRDYQKESRGWLARQFGSRNVTRTLLAEFDITNPNIKASNALFASTFVSDNTKGEIWTTEESMAVYATPFFKVNSNTTIEGRFRIQLSDERQSSAGANVMSALSQAATLIAPSSALITYFNAPLMTQASNFLNSSASKLFGQSISEQSIGAFGIKSWTGDPILIVRASMPPLSDIKNTSEKKGVGRWAVYLDPPIASMFTSVEHFNGEPNYSGISSSEILGFRLGEDLRMYDYIFSRLELQDQIDQINASPDANKARIICSRIARGLSEVGLTSYDAAAGVWAASASDQFGLGARAALQQPGICEAMDLWRDLNG